jgi:hypothetical protein
VLQQLAVVWGAARLGLVYGYGTTSQRAAHAQSGIGLLRTPVDDEALHDGLLRLLPVDEVPNDAASDPRAADHRVDGAPPTGHVAEGPQAADAPAAHLAALLADPPARRYGDAALADFATLSSTIACECPRHVAELVMQLSHFEAYSAGCARRDPADARLHEHLQRVAGTARALFEDALERLAVHEGLVKAP